MGAPSILTSLIFSKKMVQFFPTIEGFNQFLLVMSGIAVVVFVALYFVNAGYGMMYSKRWGLSVNNRIGWVLMEFPAVMVMALLWYFSPRRFELAPLAFFIVFQVHYIQRTFVFPFLMRGRNRMPWLIIVFGWMFNIANAYMQGGWIFYVAPDDLYTAAWLMKPCFWVGLAVFAAGFAINLHSDNVIRHLRAPGDTRHYIPRGGMYRYVSSANYFGELLEWIGFAILTWSAAGAVFAIWTFANLGPRAAKIHQRYTEEFGEEFTRLGLKRMIPFVY